MDPSSESEPLLQNLAIASDVIFYNLPKLIGCSTTVFSSRSFIEDQAILAIVSNSSATSKQKDKKNRIFAGKNLINQSNYQTYPDKNGMNTFPHFCQTWTQIIIFIIKIIFNDSEEKNIQQDHKFF
ncbi:hypothetical protein VNO77_43386 [Canavalia gladiata]|uniref:Uncharacterized protein n=1 Tax=Canavalia gladiata TaxID=3824 RepID=A0AAN9PMV7_CANGL